MSILSCYGIFDMAITKIAGGLVPRIAVNSSVLTVGAQGQTVIRAGMNNRKKPGRGTAAASTSLYHGSTRPAGSGAGSHKGNGSVASLDFQSLDDTIIQLDARYDALPNKTPWVDYAANVDGDWSLCANCNPASSAKKLFRQYNFNREIMGLGQVNVPFSETDFVTCGDMDFSGDALPPVGPPLKLFIGGGPGVDFWCMANVGLSEKNPAVLIPAASQGVELVGGPVFAWWEKIITTLFGPIVPGMAIGNTVHCCVWLPSGAPGTISSATFSILT